MKKFGFLLLAGALALLITPHGATLAQSNSMTVTMHAQNGSGQDGTATITEVGANDIRVVVNISNGSATAQPAHIHKGTCANLNPVPAYPLTNVVNGASDTTVMVGMATLAKGQYAINVHKSGAEVGTYVSCGDIQAMSMAGGTTTGSTSSGTTMPTTGNGAEPGLLVALALLALGLLGAGFRLARQRA